MKFVNQLFVRFSSIYGHLWSSRFQSADMLQAAKFEWASDINKFSGNDIAMAIEQCKKRFSKPPSLTEFMLLLPSGSVCHKEYIALPQKKSSKAFAQSHREKLKELLR